MPTEISIGHANLVSYCKESPREVFTRLHKDWFIGLYSDVFLEWLYEEPGIEWRRKDRPKLWISPAIAPAGTKIIASLDDIDLEPTGTRASLKEPLEYPFCQTIRDEFSGLDGKTEYIYKYDSLTEEERIPNREGIVKGLLKVAEIVMGVKDPKVDYLIEILNRFANYVPQDG